jgi:hypothetical protein
MKIYLAISVAAEHIDEEHLIKFGQLDFGDIYLKYEISISDNEKFEKRLKYLAQEVATLERNTLITGTPCHTVFDIINFNKELSQFELSVNRIYVPNQERLFDRQKQANAEHLKFNRSLGTSEEEIERNFNELERNLSDILQYGKDTGVKVMRV